MTTERRGDRFLKDVILTEVHTLGADTTLCNISAMQIGLCVLKRLEEDTKLGGEEDDSGSGRSREREANIIKIHCMKLFCTLSDLTSKSERD